MKILFLLGASSRTRNFDHTILALAERGHEVCLAGRLRKGAFDLPDTLIHERISGRVNPTQRVDEWRDFVDLLRGARDYVRYFDPRYARATRLVRRAYEIAPTEFVLFCERHPWVKRRWRQVSKVLSLCEDLIPVDPDFEGFIREEAPDLILITPLVTFESYQTDYVKAAHKLGIPIAFIPFSWDNLTNKGLMRIATDRVLVWNDTQQQEAIELHGAVPDSVVVAGAARFDDFFARTPSTTRAEFLAQYGLDPRRPMVLYLGSSQLTGPNEMELVRRWAESIRSSADERVRACSIVVRPHPALRESWTSVDLSDLGDVAISLQASRNADQDLYDSLYHAHAAVGLNTSAMLEAAIVGRPVFTLVVPGFDEGQIGTIHFYYLVEAYGGLASVARGFDEHHRQLGPALAGDPVCSERSRGFAQAFLRPHGIDRPVSPILATEIERAGTVRKRTRPEAPVWHRPLQTVLHRWLSRRRAARTAAVEDSTVVGTSLSLRPVKTALEEIQQGTAPVLVGPWVDSAASELLYWIPFLRWVSATYGFQPERLIALSRCGAGEWYASVAGRYQDVSALFSASELDHWLRRTVPQSEQNPKQAVMSPLDQEIVARAAKTFDLSDYQVLHPFTFFRVLQRLHKDRALPQLSQVLRYAPADRAMARPIAGLPKRYVAVSTAFTSALPDTAENRALLVEMLTQLTARHDVVLLDQADGLGEGMGAVPLRLLDTEEPLSGRQTRALANADAFIGPYGELAVLSSFCGTPVVAYRSERLPTGQSEALEAAGAAGWANVSLHSASRFKRVRLPEKARA